MRTAAMVLATAVLMALLGAFTRAPWTPANADDAMLRFSWRTTVTARESCRVRSAEELEALPVHMRTLKVCEPDRASYSLVIRIDDAPPDTLHLLRGGVKGDRPLFVLEERALRPGPHRVAVELLRVEEGTAELLATPLDTSLELSAGVVRLITFDPVARALVVRR